MTKQSESDIQIASALRKAIYRFEKLRDDFSLTKHQIGFFHQFSNMSEFVTQLKTAILSPLLGLSWAVHAFLNCCLFFLSLIFNLLQGKSDLIYLESFYILFCIVTGIITPLVSVMVSLASFFALFTRTLATVFPSISTDDEFKSKILDSLDYRLNHTSL